MIDGIGRFLSQGLVWPLAIVECEVICPPECQFDHVAISLEVDIFVLDAASATFDEDVVECPATAIHADGNTLLLKYTGKGATGEPGVLVTVEGVRLSVRARGVFQAINTERRFHGVADPPTQHP